MIVDEALLRAKAEDGYIVCYKADCSHCEECLRYLVGQHGQTLSRVVTAVNQMNTDVQAGHCPMYKNAGKLRMARGMTKLLTSDMPGRVEKDIRHQLFMYFGRTNYYEYRKGARLISPEQQQEIANIFKACGWNEPPQFDGFVEDYDW